MYVANSNILRDIYTLEDMPFENIAESFYWMTFENKQYIPYNIYQELRYIITSICTHENTYLVAYIAKLFSLKLLEKSFSFQAVMLDRLLNKEKFSEYRTWNSLISYMQKFLLVINLKLGQEYCQIEELTKMSILWGQEKTWTQVTRFFKQ